MVKQRTIANEISFSGIGLHTGSMSTVVFKPAPVNTGIKFVRIDLPGKPEIETNTNNVLGVIRGTTLGKEKVEIHTCEHLLSAFYGMGICNLIVELNSHEPPVMDGSSLPMVMLLEKSGIVEQDIDQEYLTLDYPIYYSNGETYLAAFPSDELKISCTIDYRHPLLRNQYITFVITPEIFKREIAPARTFCFDYEIEALKKKGLAKGGSLDNAIVIGMDRIHAKEDKLRFGDEFVRHKILDLLGDLYLIGKPLKAHIVAIRCGHNHNIAFAKEIAKGIVPDNVFPEPAPGYKMINKEEIKKIIPHRPPFLFVDKVIVLEGGLKAVGYKYLTGKEDFFRGHFPGFPIMPGVLTVETMAQVCCVLFLSRPEVAHKLAYFMTIEEAKFRRPIYPGDLLEVKIEVVRARERGGRVKGEIYVKGQLATESQFMFSLVDRVNNEVETKKE